MTHQPPLPPVPPSSSGEKPLELRSLAALAAALATCTHPLFARASPDATALLPEADPHRPPIHWCAACGALGAQEGDSITWQPSTIASLITRAELEELSQLLHQVVSLRDLAAAADPRAAPATIQEIAGALSVLSRTLLVHDRDRVDDAVALLPAASSTGSRAP